MATKNLQVTKELFVIPNKENYILYAPLKNSLLEVNSAAIPIIQSIKQGEYKSGNENLIEKMMSRGIIVDKEEKTGSACEKDHGNRPTSVTLFPTSDCRCESDCECYNDCRCTSDLTGTGQCKSECCDPADI